jgi:hypothetical protein
MQKSVETESWNGGSKSSLEEIFLPYRLFSSQEIRPNLWASSYYCAIDHLHADLLPSLRPFPTTKQYYLMHPFRPGFRRKWFGWKNKNNLASPWLASPWERFLPCRQWISVDWETSAKAKTFCFAHFRFFIILISLRDFQDGKADVIMKYSSDEARQLKSYGELPETGLRIHLTEIHINFQPKSTNLLLVRKEMKGTTFPSNLMKLVSTKQSHSNSPIYRPWWSLRDIKSTWEYHTLCGMQVPLSKVAAWFASNYFQATDLRFVHMYILLARALQQQRGHSLSSKSAPESWDAGRDVSDLWRIRQ